VQFIRQRARIGLGAPCYAKSCIRDAGQPSHDRRAHIGEKARERNLDTVNKVVQILLGESVRVQLPKLIRNVKTITQGIEVDAYAACRHALPKRGLEAAAGELCHEQDWEERIGRNGKRWDFLRQLGSFMAAKVLARK
jgi:hypothetical protein